MNSDKSILFVHYVFCIAAYLFSLHLGHVEY